MNFSQKRIQIFYIMSRKYFPNTQLCAFLQRERGLVTNTEDVQNTKKFVHMWRGSNPEHNVLITHDSSQANLLESMEELSCGRQPQHFHNSHGRRRTYRSHRYTYHQSENRGWSRGKSFIHGLSVYNTRRPKYEQSKRSSA